MQNFSCQTLVNACKRSSNSRTSVRELTRALTPLPIPSTPKAVNSRPFPHLTGAGSIPLNARPLPNTRFSVRTTVRAPLSRRRLLANVSYITERDISLPPAAITQLPELYSASGPGRAYGRVAALPRGTRAEIIAIGDCPPNVWYQIIVPGLDEPVWVVRDFVKVAVGSLAGLPRYGVTDFTPPAADERPIAVTQSETLNVRTGPGLEYDVVAEVPQGTQARIYGTDPSESWLLVELDGYSSLLWIYRYMTQVEGSLVGVRRVTDAERLQRSRPCSSSRAPSFARTGPGMAYNAVTILPKGTWARIIGVGPRSEWVLIQVAGMDQPVWIYCDLVKIIGSLAGVPQFSP